MAFLTLPGPEFQLGREGSASARFSRLLDCFSLY
jgi:hypothetical protein